MTSFTQQNSTLIISPANVNGQMYIAVSPIKTTHEQALIRQLPERYWNPKYKCWYFPKTQAYWTHFKQLFIQYTLQINQCKPIQIDHPKYIKSSSGNKAYSKQKRP